MTPLRITGVLLVVSCSDLVIKIGRQGLAIEHQPTFPVGFSGDIVLCQQAQGHPSMNGLNRMLCQRNASTFMHNK